MRILGLDIGSTSVKAVEVVAGFGRSEIHEYHEVKVHPGESALAVAGGLVKSLPRSPDRVVSSLRSNRVTIRNLKLPTRDKKAIQASVGFELEDDLPFESDQAFSDFVVLGTQGPDSNVHVSAALKSVLDDYLGLSVQSGFDPDILTTEACAYRALLRKIPIPETVHERPFVVMNLGHERSTIYAQFQGIPLFCREIAWGGRDVNLILSNRYSLSMDAAERTKIDNGFVLPASQLSTVSDQQKDFSETVFESLQPLLRHLRQAEFAIRSMTGYRPGMIYMTGGTSLLPGLPAALSEEVKTVCQPLRALSSLKSGVTYSEETDAKFDLAAGAAMCALTSERPFLINFRKGNFAKNHSGADVDLSMFLKPIKTLSVTSMVLLGILGVEYTLYESQISETNSKLEKTAREFFTHLTPSAAKSYLANTKALGQKIEAELRKERELAKLLDPNPNSPFEFLKDLSQSIGSNTVVDLVRYQVGSSSLKEPYLSPSVGSTNVELEFWVANQDMADQVKKILESKLKNLAPSPMEEVKSKKKYKIVFTGMLK